MRGSGDMAWKNAKIYKYKNGRIENTAHIFPTTQPLLTLLGWLTGNYFTKSSN